MEEETGIWGNGSSMEDFSPAATLVHFDSPVPLLRVPLPAGSSDDPSIGPFVLAFRDADSWRTAYKVTESKIIEQCLAGARVGCSITASKKCSPPWWKNLFGLAAVDFSEWEQCEEREMSLCVEASKEPCFQFAKEKCLAPFRDARIASVELNGMPAYLPNSVDCFLPQHNLEVTNYRGSVLLEGSHVQNLWTEGS